jgi:Autophagy-related protein 27
MCDSNFTFISSITSAGNLCQIAAHKTEIFFFLNLIHFHFHYFSESTILLQCTPNAKDSFLYSPIGTSANDTNLILFSKYACVTDINEKEQPGFFSTFFLILFILLLMYLVAGITYNYFVVGARGFELLPNFDFWCKLWASIKLGFFYVKNGCRVIPSEDTYDAI